MAFVEELQHLAIPLEAIKSATNNFSVEHFLGQGGFGPVYKGQLSHSKQCCDVAVKRLDSKFGQGQREFLMEIAMLSSYKHDNLVSLVGFCDEGGEKILVYKLEVNGSLDKHLSSTDLTWVQRLRICVGAARGLNYLHTGVGAEHKIVHRDIKSSNILLDQNWESKISDFGLSRFGPSNQQFTFLVSNACGTMGYVDPVYMKTGILTKESDVYSFGVLLLEVLCGRPACISNYEGERRFLAQLAQLRYEEDKLHEIINPGLIEQMHPSSLNAFSEIAFQCLKENRIERPKMELVVKDLENALTFQGVPLKDDTRMTQIGTWGRDTETPWSFLIQSNHKLKKITIGHSSSKGVEFLIFTTEDPYGQLHTSEKFGAQVDHEMEQLLLKFSNGPFSFFASANISEINLDSDEKIIGVNGTRWGCVTSLCFVTNKNTYGPFGAERTQRIPFLVPFDLGEFVGCFGCCSPDAIESIGFSFKPRPREVSTTIKMAGWGDFRNDVRGSPWSFYIKSDDKLRKITINHYHILYSLIFTTEDRYGKLRNSMFGCQGPQDCEIYEVNFDDDEKVVYICGTYGEIDTKLFFNTNKKIHELSGNKDFRTVYGDYSRMLDDGVGEFCGCYGITGLEIGIQDIGCYFRVKQTGLA